MLDGLLCEWEAQSHNSIYTSRYTDPASVHALHLYHQMVLCRGKLHDFDGADASPDEDASAAAATNPTECGAGGAGGAGGASSPFRGLGGGGGGWKKGGQGGSDTCINGSSLVEACARPLGGSGTGGAKANVPWGGFGGGAGGAGGGGGGGFSGARAAAPVRLMLLLADLLGLL